MHAKDDEESRLRSVALQNSQAILLARQRAEEDLTRAKEALEIKSGELAHSLAMIRATLESTTDGILVTDEKGRITDFNEQFVQMWQVPRQLLEGHTHPEFQEFAVRHVREPQVYRQRLTEIYSLWPAETADVLEFNDGRVFERHSKIQRVADRNVGRVWSFRDITARRRSEAELREQREWFQVTLSSIGDAVITTDTDGRVTFLNPVAEVMTGWKTDEARGRALAEVFQIVNETTRKPVANPVTQVLREGVIVGLANHTVLISRHGTEIAIEDSAAPIRNAAGKISGAVMVFHDVTRRRRAEERLKDSEQHLRAMFSQTAVGMATAALNGRFEEVNPRFSEILGYSAAELLERTFRDLTHPDDLPATEVQMRRLMAGEIANYVVEKRYIRKDGKMVWCLVTVAILRDEKGNPARFVGVVEDISQRHAAEEALHARERELSLIYHNVSDLIFYLAAWPAGSFRFVSVNQAFLAATGLPESRVTGKTVEEVIPEPLRSLFMARSQEAIREKRTVRWEETASFLSGPRVGMVSLTPIFDPAGKCINLIGTIHDTSERRRTEETRARLGAVVESSDDAIISKTLEGIITTWNKSAERIFGYTAQEAIGQSVKMLIPPDRIDEEPAILQRIRKGERVDHYETVRRRKDGTLFDISVTISPIRDANGVIIGASKIARDVTEQRKTEEVLRSSEERYRLMGQVVPHLLWITDPAGRPSYFNERWYAYTGQREAEAFIPDRPSALHPDDRKSAMEAWESALKSGQPFEYEYRLRRHDGAYRWFVGRGMPLRDETGKIVRWYGSSTDVHEQKITAEALRDEYTVTEQLNDVARALATELELPKIAQIITDAGTKITRAQFGAFYHNHLDEKGESYTLDTLSGASREAFAKFRMPRATEIFGPTFRGEGVIRHDDVRKDPRFGKNAPYQGMPAEHLPVVSYLAVPVVSRMGTVLGGLFFGHAEAGNFTERDEKIIVGVAAQAAAAMDNARLYLAERQTRAAAERANKAKDDFLATLSHELRNPLNPVLLIASEAAQNAELSPEVRADFEMIQRNVELEARLIDDLLDLTRITRRKMSLELRPVEAHGILQEAIAIVRRDAEAKEIALTSSFLAQRARVMGDPARLQQIFWNVLRNAVKFTPERGRVGITTRNRTGLDELEIEVVDSGIGMSPEEMARIFDAFSQGDHATASGSHRFGGLGLGLAIAHYLVRMHGGRIEAVSEGANKGATFTIHLPLLDRGESAEITGK